MNQFVLVYKIMLILKQVSIEFLLFIFCIITINPGLLSIVKLSYSKKLVQAFKTPLCLFFYEIGIDLTYS